MKDAKYESQTNTIVVQCAVLVPIFTVLLLSFVFIMSDSAIGISDMILNHAKRSFLIACNALKLI
jgi:hypothetical protein